MHTDSAPSALDPDAAQADASRADALLLWLLGSDVLGTTRFVTELDPAERVAFGKLTLAGLACTGSGDELDMTTAGRARAVSLLAVPSAAREGAVEGVTAALLESLARAEAEAAQLAAAADVVDDLILARLAAAPGVVVDILNAEVDRLRTMADEREGDAEEAREALIGLGYVPD